MAAWPAIELKTTTNSDTMKPLYSSTLVRSALVATAIWGAGMAARADYPAEVLALKPLTYWRFDDTGTFSYTATNQGTTGAIDNGRYSDPAFMQGQPGALVGSTNTAARFNGSNSKIDVPFDAALNPASFSVECWAKVEGGAGNYRSPVTSRESANGVTAGYIIYAGAGNTWEFWTGNGSSWNAITTSATNGAVVTNVWTHLVGTYDANSQTMSFYINGALIMQRTNSVVAPVGTVGSPRPLRIGSGATEGTGNYWFNGDVDEVAVYPSVLTPDEVAANYATGTTNGSAYAAQVLALHPALYLRLDDTSSNPPAANLGTLGAAANGTYQNGLKPTDTDLVAPSFPGFGSSNPGVAFDGNGEAMAIGSTNIPVPWTMTCWVNRQDAPGGSAVLMYSPSGGIKLEQWQNTREAGFTAYGVADYTFNYSAPTGTWTHLAFVCTGDAVTLYANGEYADSISNTITLPMTSLASQTGDLLAGSVDEVATFNRALLQGQVKTLYLTAIGDQNPPDFVNNVPIASPAGTLYATLPFSLNIDVYGAGPLTYQWRKDGTVVGTNATYTVAAATSADSGNYDVVVANAHGTVTSAVLNVAIQPTIPASIAQQPIARQVYPGGTALFTVTAAGTAPISYQWEKGGANITGATSQTLTITNAGPGDVATYSVAVTNSAGGAVSSGADLTLRTPAAGSYEAAVVASGPAAYWQMGETSGTTAYDYMGGHDAVYTNVTLGVPGYAGIGANTAVGFDPANPNGPGSASIPDGSVFPFIGATPSFTLEAWVKWNDITGVQRVFSYPGAGFQGIGFGANTANGLRFTTFGVQDFNLTLPAPLQTNTWYYLVGVANAGTFYFYLNGVSVGSIAFTGPPLAPLPPLPAPFAIGRSPEGAAIEPVNGSIEEAAVYDRALTSDEILTHYSVAAYGTTTPPQVRIEPSSQTVVAGTTPSLSATIVGSVPISYQWEKDGVSIPGATSATLSLTNVYFTDNGSYVLWATNAAGFTNTAAATLAVLPPPSFANVTNGLVLHLNFEGDSLADSSGQGNDAYADGSPSFVPGQIGTNALYVNTQQASGIYNSAIVYPSPSLSFSETNSFSVGFWVKYTGLPNDLPMIANAVNSTYQLGWVFTDDGGKIEVSLVSNGAYVADPVANSPTTDDGNWHHVLGVVDRDSQTALAYVDGRLAGTWSIAGLGSLDTAQTITLGQDPTGVYAVDGAYTLDDVGIWERPLTAYEAASIYAAGERHQSFNVVGPVALSIYHVGDNIDLAWQAGTLLQSSSLNGPFTPVQGAAAPYYRTTVSGTAMYFRVRQ